MKKKLLMAMVLALVLTACGAKETQDNASPSKENVEANVEEGNSDSSEAASEVADMDMYEAFLNNEEVVYGDRVDYANYYSESDADFDLEFEKGRGYTLTEFVLRNVECEVSQFESADLTTVNYAYIDCGNDGVKELAIQLIMDSEYMGQINKEYIIKEIGGKLQICYRAYGLYRTEEYIANNYGLIYSGGSSSAYSYSSGYGYVNEDGDYVFLNSVETEYGLGCEFDGLGGIYDVASKYRDDIDVDQMYMDGYVFSNPSDFDFENNDYSEYLKTIEYVAYPEGDELVQNIFDEAGIKLYTEAEMQAKVLADVESKGLSKEIYENRDYVEWQEIESEELENVVKYGINPVFVTNTAELVEAICDNVTIVLEPGVYNLTEYLNENFESISYRDYEEENPAGVLYGGYEDELEFYVNNLENLKIMSKDSKNRAEIVCVPRYAQVMTFENCRNVTVEDVIMGHTIEQGVCSGDVIAFSGSSRCQVTNCDLYGCGAYGLNFMGAEYVTVTNTKIHDCSYGCVESYGSEYIFFDSCEFVDCREYTMFDIYGGTASFYNCSFKNLEGDMLGLNDETYIYFNNCVFDANALASVNSYAGPGVVTIY